jgi:hypothetical protein
MKLRHMIAVSFVFAHVFVQAAQAQVTIAPRISSFGASIRYSAAPVSAGLNSDIISQLFQEVISLKFASDTARAGLDETMYFRLRSGGVGTKNMLRLRRMSRLQAIVLYSEKRLQITDGWSPVSKSNVPQNDLYKREKTVPLPHK